MEEGFPIYQWLSMWQQSPRWSSHVSDRIESLHSLLSSLSTRMWIETDPERFSWHALFYTPDQRLHRLDATIVNDMANGLRFNVWPSQQQPTGNAIGDPSPWKRSMLWTRAVLKPMEGYREQVEDIDRRLALYKPLNKLKEKTVQRINKAFAAMFGQPSQLPDQVDVAIADWYIMPGKIAAYTPPVHTSHGKVTLASRALQDWDYVRDILLHELIHGAFGPDGCLNDCSSHSDTHHEDFQRLATHLGLPKKYQH